MAIEIEGERSAAISEQTVMIEKHLNNRYPFIQDQKDRNFLNFMNTRIPFCSFEIEKNDNFLKELLIKSLIKASDPYDSAFCRHGYEKHPSFIEALTILQETIFDGDVEIKHALEAVDINKKVIPDTRYIVESPWEVSGGQVVKAKAIFLDVPTVAYKFLSYHYGHPRDPEIYRYINREYEGHSTSRVITAYLQKKIN